MNIKKTIVLAFILLLSALYLTKISIPTRAREAKTQSAFAVLNQSEIERIDLSTINAALGTFQIAHSVDEKRLYGEAAGGQSKLSGTWTIVKLIGAPLDTTELDSFVTALINLKIDGPIDEKQLSPNFSVYGLDLPALTVVVHRGKERSTEAAFGKLNSFLSKRYVKVSGRSGIFLADESSFTALNKGSNDIRSKTPLEFNVADVRQLIVRSSQGSVTLKQPAVGEWKITEPRELSASSETVGELLQTLGSLQVAEFLDGQQGDLGRYKLDTPEVQIELTFRDGLTHNNRTVSISAAQSPNVLKDEEAAVGAYFTYTGAPSVFKTESDSGKQLTKGVDDLREQRLFSLTVSDIAKVRSSSTGGAPEVEIAVNRTDWDVNGKLSDPVFVEQILEDIIALKAVEFPLPESVPTHAFKTPFLILSITKKGDLKELVTLTVGAEAKGRAGPARYARVGEQGVTVLISDIEAKRIVLHEEALIAVVTPIPSLAVTKGSP